MNPTAAAPAAHARPAFTLDTNALWNDSARWVAANTASVVIALIVGGVVAALLLGVKAFGGWLAKRNATQHHWRRIIGSALAKTRLWFIVAVTAQVVATFAHAPPDLAKTVYFLFVIAATLQAAVFAREVVLGFVEYRATGDESHAGLSSALGIIRLLVTILLFAIAAILILSNLGVNVTGLIAGLGVGGIAIGLAAQGIFADLFAALAILFDRPFRIGDSVKYDTTNGTVEAIGLKSTRIRAQTGEQVIIANKQLLDKEIHNLARLAKRRTVVMLGLTYQTDLKLLAEIPGIVRAVIESCGNCEMVRCGLMKFGDSSLDFELQYDVHSEEFQKVFEARHLVHIAILRKFAELGIDFAYPTQVAFTAGPDGKPVFPSKADIVEAQ